MWIYLQADPPKRFVALDVSTVPLCECVMCIVCDVNKRGLEILSRRCRRPILPMLLFLCVQLKKKKNTFACRKRTKLSACLCVCEWVDWGCGWESVLVPFKNARFCFCFDVAVAAKSTLAARFVLVFCICFILAVYLLVVVVVVFFVGVCAGGGCDKRTLPADLAPIEGP